eukprot:6185855-Pleurochrysis_carterae.AAC.2
MARRYLSKVHPASRRAARSSAAPPLHKLTSRMGLNARRHVRCRYFLSTVTSTHARRALAGAASSLRRPRSIPAKGSRS